MYLLGCLWHEKSTDVVFNFTYFLLFYDETPVISGWRNDMQWNSLCLPKQWTRKGLSNMWLLIYVYNKTNLGALREIITASERDIPLHETKSFYFAKIDWQRKTKRCHSNNKCNTGDIPIYWIVILFPSYTITCYDKESSKTSEIV